MHYPLLLKSKKNIGRRAARYMGRTAPYNHPNTKKSGGGFTLLETLIAIFVITVGLIGGMSAIVQTLRLSSYSSSKLTAAYLAQEGIEIVRNIRDTNWLEAETASNYWDEGLFACSIGCIVDYKHSYGLSFIDPVLPSFFPGNPNTDKFLNIDSDGFYSYAAGAPTKFKRLVIIHAATESQKLEVAVRVTWSAWGKFYSFSVQENLYDWR